MQETQVLSLSWKDALEYYSKVAGYKINTQKSLEFLYTNNEKTESEIKETISFTIEMERIKYLGIYLPKESKGLYAWRGGARPGSRVTGGD